MVSTIAATLFISAMILAIWSMAWTVRAHAVQIMALLVPERPASVMIAKPRKASSQVRRPVKVSPLRRSSLRAAA
jgi:hypothetical protein